MATTNPMDMSGSTYYSPYGGQQTDASQAPVLPNYNPIYDPTTESLGNSMQGMLSNVNYNQQPLQQLQQNAESTTPSPWAQLQSQLGHQQTGQAASTAANQAAASTAQAQGNLALSGGLSSGANERTQEAGEQAGIGAQQSIQNEGNTNQAKIGIQDSSNKQQEMMALPGMEAQSYSAQLQPISMEGQAQAQDVSHQIASDEGQNQFNMAAYGNQAGMYGADQTAKGQEAAAASSGGSWLCTERGKLAPFTISEKRSLKKLLQYSMRQNAAQTRFYLTKGSELVDRIKEQDFSWARTTNMEFINTVLKVVAAGDMAEAYNLYCLYTHSLYTKYWPGCSADSVTGFSGAA